MTRLIYVPPEKSTDPLRVVALQHASAIRVGLCPKCSGELVVYEDMHAISGVCNPCQSQWTLNTRGDVITVEWINMRYLV